MSKKQIAILFGGRSGEHQVSIISASSVVNRLKKDKYDVHPIYITLEGKWLYPIVPEELLKDAKIINKANEVAILPDPSKKGLYLLGENQEKHIDVVFPVMHGTYGEDGTIQ
ncbi:MAG: D-alanine--D-alanine ligase A, partial [Bacillota bacterium]|nr:D-alanine--D-alanine ligase A [Bacillota bacterium]